VNEDQERRVRISSQVDRVDLDIEAVIDRTDREPDLVKALEDHELLALDAWLEGQNEVIAAECERRRADHEHRARRFAFRGTVELVPILAERARS
jgi:hypothetical protein